MQGGAARAGATGLGWLETVAAPGSPDHGAAAEAAAVVETEGFDAIWLRAAPGGGDGTVLFAAALAGLTARARIGVAAPPRADLHPLRLAEDLAMIDVASGGRLDWIPTRDGAMSAPEQAEYVAVVVEAWRGEAFEHAGPRWPFPEVVCVPSPEQRPHPPVWLGPDCARPPEADGSLTGRWLDDPGSLGEIDEAAPLALVCRLHGEDLSTGHDLEPLLERGSVRWLIVDSGGGRRDVAATAGRRLAERFAERPGA